MESTEDEFGLIRTPNRRSSINRQTVLVLHKQVGELEAALQAKGRELMLSQIAFCEADKNLQMERAKLEEQAAKYADVLSGLQEAEEKCEVMKQQKDTLEEKVNHRPSKKYVCFNLFTGLNFTKHSDNSQNLPIEPTNTSGKERQGDDEYHQPIGNRKGHCLISSPFLSTITGIVQDRPRNC